LTLFLAMAAACVASAGYMAAPIPHLVSVKVIEGLISTVRMWTSVAVMWIEAVIHVTVEVGWAVKPRTGSQEHAAVEPLGAVVTVRGTVVWGDVVIAIRANRLCSYIDRDLSGCRARHAHDTSNQARKCKEF